MRVLVTADTHGPHHPLPDFLLAAAGEADLILHAGDACDRPTLLRLGARAPLYAVRGNRDLDLELPERLLLTVGGVRIGLVHGSEGPGRHTPERAWRSFDPRPEIIVYGHDHTQRTELREGTWLVNPGSPVKPYDGRRSALWLEIQGGDVTWRSILPP